LKEKYNRTLDSITPTTFSLYDWTEKDTLAVRVRLQRRNDA
jgi:hypothetical protein